MAQQPVIRISLKHFKLYLLLSINISISSILVFHSRFSFHQKHWLKSHLKNKCMNYSPELSWQRAQLTLATCKFFLSNKSLVFSQSWINNQKKNVCLGWTHDFHIQLKGLGAWSDGDIAV
jgi:hypothetical protein